MLRQRFRRLIASSLGAFLLIALGGEALAAHPCPMHDGSLVAATTSAAHGDHHGAGAQHDQEESAPENRQCCCPDTGCCSALVILATFAAALVGETVAIADPISPDVGTPAPSRVQLVLPHANAPPVLPPHATLPTLA